MKKRTAFLISSLIAIICSILLIFLYHHVGYLYLSSVLWINRLEQFDKITIVYTTIILFSIIVLLNCYLLLRNKVNKIFLNLEFIIYLILLLVFLLLKSPGTRGINLSFDRFIMDLHYSTFEIVMNTILFIPLGLFLGSKKKLISTVIISFVFIFSIEIVQYVFRLGIFDVIDIATNFSGVVIGYMINKIYSVLK